MVNKVILLGHVSQDVEIRYTQSGSAVANFSLATNERYKNKAGEQVDKAEFHKLVAFGKLAEIIGQWITKGWITKGQLLYIEGKLQTRSWEDKNGNKRYTTEIVAREMKMLSKGEKKEVEEEDDGDVPW